MADIKTFRPRTSASVGSSSTTQTITDGDVLQVTNTFTDASGVETDTTIDVITYDVDNAGNILTQYNGNLNGDSIFIDTSGDAQTVLDITSTPDSVTQPEQNVGSDSIFVGASNRLNVYNGIANGLTPLDSTGRKNYNILTLNETAYGTLETAGTVDANTLYLIREDI